MSDTPERPPQTSPIDFLRTRSLTNVVQGEIERMIVDGELRPGERVNENGLAQKLGVSRGPIREGCSALSAMGLVEVVPHRGFFVRNLSDAEAAEISEARAGVFAFIGRLLTERITDAETADLSKLVERMDRVDAADEPGVYYAINLEFHDAIIGMCGNTRLAHLYRGFVRELHVHGYRGYRGLNVPQHVSSSEESGDLLLQLIRASNAEHRAMCDALIDRDPERAFETFHDHIMNGLVRNLRLREVERRAQGHPQVPDP